MISAEKLMETLRPHLDNLPFSPRLTELPEVCQAVAILHRDYPDPTSQIETPTHLEELFVAARMLALLL